MMGQAVQECLTFKALWSTHPLGWHHIPDNLNPQQYHQSENFKFGRFLHLRYWYLFIKLHCVTFQKELLKIRHIHDGCSVMHQVELWVSFCSIIPMISCRRTIMSFLLGCYIVFWVDSDKEGTAILQRVPQHCYIQEDFNLLQNCYKNQKFCIKQQMLIIYSPYNFPVKCLCKFVL
jgi:hypothetical protein